jgi:hypothetical protein
MTAISNFIFISIIFFLFNLSFIILKVFFWLLLYDVEIAVKEKMKMNLKISGCWSDEAWINCEYNNESLKSYHHTFVISKIFIQYKIKSKLMIQTKLYCWSSMTFLCKFFRIVISREKSKNFFYWFLCLNMLYRKRKKELKRYETYKNVKRLT